MREAVVSERSLAEGLEAAVRHLLDLQQPEGYWWARLASNVCMEAEYVMLLHCLGIDQPRQREGLVRHILATQTGDGGWTIFPGGPSDLSASVEAYQALKLAGVEPDSEPMQRARAFIRSAGGIPRTRVFTRIWLALLGQYPWEDLPILPPEAIFLPPWFPLNIYDFSSWARATIVPLAILMSRRPQFPVLAAHGVQELWPDTPVVRPEETRTGGWEVFFRGVDRLLHLYHHHPWRGLRQRAEALCLRWILEHQEADGSWGGIQPPWVYSLLVLKTLGLEDAPAYRRGVEGLSAFGVEEPDGRYWFQACISPTWDTALAVLALREAGLGAHDPRLVTAGLWLLEQQVFEDGDWKVRRPKAQGGGWPFEWVNKNYPDLDDTALVLLALNRLRLPHEERRKRSLTRGFRWLVAMQSKNGGWAAFDADNLSPLAAKIPFSDFGAATDPPTEDVTGHVLECLGGFGYDEAFDVVARAVAFLRRLQRPDGSFWGRWGVNHIYGTGAVLPGLKAVGVDMTAPWVVRAADWVEAHQNEDGGWGEDCRSYEDERYVGRGPSTPSQTAWALLALLAAGRADSPAAARGVAYLLASQRPDGGWDESYYTGTGFPRDFYIGYGLYRDVFPVLALGRYRQVTMR